ncbi:zonular occludens toxin domain-containing protein [Azovibrio restrictus]|uniref:zonular occludens toxin domain-containing protein n=1 Tax=Azovibrio restrictus TaxID=146938 RepID=UPI0026EB1A6E|nr:zonular occludens toxin domain-containing protein [Azovibrio restrictus]MDD3482996.1 zonular occludens toxin domain-containing protein [Azovibrio restrictus]
MSIKLYTGRMGSGKTYEVVSVVILGALARGRRVVSNIAGLNYEAMKALLVESGIPPEQVGQLVQITHAQVEEPQFWRTDKDEAEGVDSFIQPGDLVCLDEIWRFWEGFASRKMPARVMNFYRMHRHFAHPETGVTCDVALITQDPGDLSRRVRAVVEETYRMEKLTAVGMAKRYRVDIFSGCGSRPQFLRSLQRTYEEKYFPLYKSHSQAKDDSAGPKEENIDRRGNIFGGALFKIILPLMIPLAIGCIYMIVKFFDPETHNVKSDKTSSSKSTTAPENQKSASSSPQAPPPKPPEPSYSSRWRITGYYRQAGRTVYVLSDNSGISRHEYVPEVLASNGLSHKIKTDGEFITDWTGAPQENRIMP